VERLFHDNKTINENRSVATILPEDIPIPVTVQVWVVNIPGGTNLNGPCGGGPSAKLTFTIN